MNEEILAGMKSAIAHGFSPEEAVASFINAGNNPQEVNEVKSFISREIPSLPSLSKTTETIVQQEITEQKAAKPGASKRMKLILLILITLILVGLSLSFLLFREKFIGFVIDPIFP